jgi:phosphate transport system permease protein
MVLSVLAALAPLVLIVVDVVRLGAAAIRPSFFTQGPPGDVSALGGGALNGIIGTVMMVGLAIALAVPVGIMGAIYLVELARDSRFARSVRFFADVMTGIPSIVFGIFVYSAVVLVMHHFSALAGAVALALIMWPIVLRTSEEILRLVPNEIREASYALGVPQWRTVWKVVLPSAASGLVTGTMLAVARVAGETAPLLFTALGNQFVTTNINAPMSALPLEIFRGATSAFAASIQRAWAAALTLLVLVLLLSLGGRWLAARREARS